MYELGQSIWTVTPNSEPNNGAVFTTPPTIAGGGIIGHAQTLHIGQVSTGTISARLLVSGMVVLPVVTDGQSWTPDQSMDGANMVLEAVADDGGALRMASGMITQAPPVVTAGLSDMSLTGATGVHQQDCAAAFSGAALAYSLDVPRTGVSIDGASGILSVDTAQSGQLNAVQINVRAQNSGGQVSSGFLLTVSGTQSAAVPIEHGPTLVLRNAMAAVHLTPVADGLADGENAFTGFADTTGWTVVDASSANEALAAVAATGVNEKKLIRCNWTGASNYSGGENITATNAALLTSDPAVDWGYQRPDWSVRLVAGAGFAPVITRTAGDFIDLIGFHWWEVVGVTFDGVGLRHQRTGTFPGISVSAYRSCVFRNIAPGIWAIEADLDRTLHVEDCLFENNESALNGSANYFRSWNNVFRQHGDNDIHAMRKYNGHSAGWTAHAWIAGAHVFDQKIANTGSGLHPDFFQVSHANDAHQGYAALIEFNIVHSNRHPDSYPSQGIFGDDGSGYDGQWCVHNNILALMAYWGCHTWDPNDNSEKRVYRNLFARAAEGQDQDSYQRIRGGRSVAGNGMLDVRENYYARDAQDEGRVNNEVFSANVPLDFRGNAAASRRPENILTGNNSWTSNAYGRTSYTAPDTGLTDPVAAKAAITAFMQPQVGWRGAGAGPIDPAFWPAAGTALL